MQRTHNGNLEERKEDGPAPSSLLVFPAHSYDLFMTTVVTDRGCSNPPGFGLLVWSGEKRPKMANEGPMCQQAESGLSAET